MSQFKPSEPCHIDKDIVIVPSGWKMDTIQSGSKMHVCLSHFVFPTDWSDDIAWAKFRDWIIFDSFVMSNNRGTTYFDKNILILEDVAYTIPEGEIGDAGDIYKAADYNDITHFLVNEFEKPKNLPSLSYAKLYEKYLTLPKESKEAMEWLVSPPPSPLRSDAFFGHYWGLLHLTILLENIIGLPPNCDSPPQQCETCKETLQPHRRTSRRVWLREELNRRIQESTLVEEYAKIIEVATKVRNSMSHKPHFDRSTRPAMNFHGQTFSYDTERSVKDYSHDTNALSALLLSLKELAHSLIVDQAFEIKHYATKPPLQVTMVKLSG